MRGLAGGGAEIRRLRRQGQGAGAGHGQGRDAGGQRPAAEGAARQCRAGGGAGSGRHVAGPPKGLDLGEGAAVSRACREPGLERAGVEPGGIGVVPPGQPFDRLPRRGVEPGQGAVGVVAGGAVGVINLFREVGRVGHGQDVSETNGGFGGQGTFSSEPSIQ